jgi:hypothetical protein
MEPLEKIIREVFIPSLFDGHTVSDIERTLLCLPIRLGGMALENPTDHCEFKYQASVRSTNSLTTHIILQKENLETNQNVEQAVKLGIKKEIIERERESTKQIMENLPPEMHRAVSIAQEKGASSFLTSLPLERHGLSLSKTEFRDAIFMRYRWPLKNLPSTCICGKPFSLDHSQMCHLGGFVNMRHDSIRDLLANEMAEVLHDVQTEPPLTPLSGEAIIPRNANTEDDARSDIRARGFWMKQQSAFFDIRVFYPHAPSYSSKSLSNLCNSFEGEKKRKYADRIFQVEHASFTPLVFSCCGGMGQETAKAIKKLASLLSDKRKEPYSHTIALLRLRISIALLKSAIICLRGTRTRRSSAGRSPAAPSDVVMHELHVEV